MTTVSPATMSPDFLPGAVFLSVVMFLFTCPFVGPAWVRGFASRRWPTTCGHITSSTIVGWVPRGGGSEPDVRYGYAVEGVRHEGRVVAFYFSRGVPAAAIVNRYPRGRQVTVYYNPKSPEESVLEPGVTRRDLIIGLVTAFGTPLLMLVIWGAAAISAAFR